MIKIVLAIVISTVPVAAFAVEPNGMQQSKKDSKGKTDTNNQAKPCAEYGEGFRRIEGSSTCVKIGGYVRFQTGRTR